MTPPQVLNLTAGTPPTGARYIGRAMPSRGLTASKWANRHKIESDHERPAALANYLEDLRGSPELLNSLHELAGGAVVCWCSPKLCHGHVLAQCVAALPEGDPVAEARQALIAEHGDEWRALAALDGWISDLAASWKDVAKCDVIRWWIRRVDVPKPRELF